MRSVMSLYFISL